MRKFFNVFFVGLLASFTLLSCSNDRDANYTDNDTYSVVYDVTGSFQYDTNAKLWILKGNFNRNIPTSDVVLIYKRAEVDNGLNVWEPLPTIYHAGEYQEIPTGKNLKYTFDFTTADFRIIAWGDYDFDAQTTAFKNGYLNNQTFRIVIVPASFGANKYNKKSLNQVMKNLNITEKDVKVLK